MNNYLNSDIVCCWDVSLGQMNVIAKSEQMRMHIKGKILIIRNNKIGEDSVDED